MEKLSLNALQMANSGSHFCLTSVVEDEQNHCIMLQNLRGQY